MSVTLPGIGSFVIAGKNCAIKDGSVKGSLSLTADSNSETTFICAAADYLALLVYLLTANSFNIGGYACEHGAAHPLFPTHFCYECDAVPIEPNTGVTTWAYWELRCKFKPFIFDPGTPVLVKKYSFEPCGQMLTLPPSTSAPVGFTVGGAAINQQYANLQPVQHSFFVPLYRYKVTIYNCITLPLATINSLIGTVNNGPFVINCGQGATNTFIGSPGILGYGSPNSFTAPKGCMVYEGIGDTSQVVSNQGAGRFDITHTWTVSIIDQNKVPNWDLMSSSSTNLLNTVMVVPDQLKYPYANHGLLNPLGIF